MTRKTFFAGLFAALPGAAKESQAAPVGDLISDCREWGPDHQYQPFETYVNGVRVKGVYYINYTKGFVKNYLMEGDNLAFVRQKIGAHENTQYAKNGHCFLCRNELTEDGFLAIGRGAAEDEMPIPDGYEIVTKDGYYWNLSRTVYGKIETRPLAK